MPDDLKIKIEGLRELRKALGIPSRKIVKDELTEAVEPIAVDARAGAPRGTTPLRKRDRHIADTIRSYVSGNRISIGSPHPGAGVLNFGGTIAPRGTPITFKPRNFVERAHEAHADGIVDDIGDAIERAFGRIGH